MATPFVPVPIQARRTASGGCRSRPRRISPSGSPSSSSSGSSPPGRTPWIRGAGSWGKTVARRPSLPQPASNPDGYGRRTRGAAEGSSSPVQEDGCPGGGWVKRPITPTLLGYEIMEERAKFTVYKILVTGLQGDTWVIFRRYTDFSRLNDKLKEIFPRFRLALPPKRWFKDNYDMEFLEERQIGLQIFLQNLLAHKDIINSEVVRQFLCLDEPPGPFDSLVESRAFCETLEETNHRLQTELLEKQREIASLQITLEERESRIALLEERVNVVSPNPESSESPCRLSAEGSESNGCTDLEADRHRATVTDVHRDTETDRHRDTETDVHRDTETDRHRDTDEHREADGHRATETDVRRDAEADVRRDAETDVRRDTETDVRRDTETDVCRDTETDVRRDTETDIHRATVTDVHRDTETDIHRATETDLDRDAEADGHKATETEVHRDTETDGYRGTEIDGHRDTETDVHRDTETDVHRDTETDVHRNTEEDVLRDTDGRRPTETDVHKDTKEDGHRDTKTDRHTETEAHRDTETDRRRDADKNEDAEQRSSIPEAEQEPDERREAPGSEKGCGAYWNNLAISGSPIPS